MSMKSGKDSQNQTERTAQSQELPSNESMSTRDDKAQGSTTQLALKPGQYSNVYEAASSSLINIAEENDGQPLTERSKDIISRFVEQSTKGFAGSIPMMCAGTRCPYISACPLNEAGSKLPIGKKCPVEATIVATWVSKHLKFLGIEDINDPIHSFDMDMLYELAGQELLRWRCSVHLSDDPALISNVQVGGTVHGEPIFSDVINPVLDIMEKAGKNIAKLREALVATRAAQITAGQDILDPTEKSSQLRKQANELVKRRLQAKKDQEQLKDAEFEVKKDETI